MAVRAVPLWSRDPSAGYEVSSRGDRRFSAFYAQLPDGRTIEDAWGQAKGYQDGRAAKGRPAMSPDFDYWGTYKGLWQQWADANPGLIDELAQASQGRPLVDRFAKTENNQAKALAEILAERGGAQQPMLEQPAAVGRPTGQTRMAGDRAVADTVKRIYAGIGSRETPPEVLALMTQLAGRLEREGWLLRSGGAPGADSAFEMGVQDPRNRAIYLPWPGFQDKYPGNGFYDAQRLPGWQGALASVNQYHPAPDRLSRGGRALMARNAMQVLGPDLSRPADLIVAWTPDGRVTGGTGQALRMAQDQGIKIRNLGDPAVLESVMRYLDVTP